MERRKELYIIRGLPGSGKSTLAREITAKEYIFSADDYFMVCGYYCFNAGLQQQAHLWCQWRAQEAMRMGISPVVIDNTNTRFWEMRPYVWLAQEFGYQVLFREPANQWSCDPFQCSNATKHNVPIEKIINMHQSWECNPTVEKVLASYL